MTKRNDCFGKSILAMLLSIIVSNNVFAGQAYRDFEVEVFSPSSAQGLVYVDVVPKRPHKAYSFISSGPGQNAKVKANFGSVTGNDFRCELLAYPKPGYALAGYVGINDYRAGKKSNYLPTYEMSLNTVYFLDFVQESDKTENDPIESNSYKFSTNKKFGYYAIFKPAVKVAITVSKPGEVKSALLRTGKGENINDIIVEGPINEQDIQYLNYLVKEKELIRIDLSMARISTIPESAFSSCATLYEIKLPSSGLITIGEKAFFQCSTLKKVVIPPSVTHVSSDAFDACYTIEKGFHD